jgi:ABC-type multidrug transport system ATPase subunit
MMRYIAYVIEEDLFYETVTVREHLIFQARLRLGKTMTEEQYMLRVDEIIEELGLTHRRDALVGGAGRRGLLRWERKLLSIATEMLSNPSVLLVEEPTSGLDSLSSEIVVLKLQQLARSGRTVIVTVHHPTSEVFALVDNLYLLSEGTVVYSGKASEANGYFASLGYECPAYQNPIGYYLRLLVVDSRETDHAGAARLAMLREEWARRDAAAALEATPFEAGPTDSSADIDGAAGTRLGFFGQLNVLMTRNIIRLIRYRYWFFLMLIWVLVVALVFGLIFLQLDMTQRGIQNTSGAFFYLMLVLIILMAYRTFAHLPMDLALMSRERSSGSYYVISWFIARSLCAVPREIILPVVFFVPVYFLMDIGYGFSVYFYMQVTLILVSSAAIGLGYLVMSLIRRVWLAWIVYAVWMMIFIVFCGYFVSDDDIPDGLAWIQYISPINYGYEGFMNLYWGEVDVIECDSAVENCVARSGSEVLAYYSLRRRSALTDGLILLAINFAYRLLALCLLMWTRRPSLYVNWTHFESAFSGRFFTSATKTDAHGSTRRSITKVLTKDVAATRSSLEIESHHDFIQMETPRTGPKNATAAEKYGIEWRKLWLKITMKNAATKQVEEKVMLSHVNGSANPGEFLLITGTSAAESKLLLECIGGRNASVEGSIAMNGKLGLAR